MPTLLRLGPYRCFVYSNEGDEPSHIHVESGDRVAKFWLGPVELAANHGFRAHELTALRKLVEEHQDTLVEAWHAYFGR